MKAPYQTPHAPTSVGGFDGRALVLAVIVFVLANWIATQYCAYQFRYQPSLGKPLLRLHQGSIYTPWSWAVWTLRTVRHPETAQSVRTIHFQACGIVFLGFFAAVAAFYLSQHARVRSMAHQAKNLHGSAAWATRRDVQKSGLLKSQHGVYVGAWNDRGRIRYLRHDGQDHVLAFAPTRTGKGVALVLPTLLGSWFDSAVIYDIKGENWDKSAGFRSTLGPIFRFAPCDEHGSSRFNPLAEIRLDTDRDIADAQSIAGMMVVDGASKSEPYWAQAAENLLAAAILHVCYAATREGRIACLGDVRDSLTEPGSDIRTLLGRWQQFHHRTDGTPHPVIGRMLQEVLDKEDRNFDGVFSQAAVALKVYIDPVVARNTAASDFRIDDLVNFELPVSLYLVVPAGQQERLRPLTRLLFTILVNRLTERKSTTPNKHRLLLLIDEFPSLKKMDIFGHALSYIAGYGIKALLIAQDIRQLEEAYGAKESIVSNCNVRVAFAPNTYETASLLSNMLGKQTVLRQAYGFSGRRFSPLPSNMSTSMDHTERPLLTADEIGRLRAPEKEGDGPEEKITAPGDELVFVAGCRPILAIQLLYFGNPLLLERSQMQIPPYRISIEAGKVVDQKPLTRLPNIVSKPELPPSEAELPVTTAPKKVKRKKASDNMPEDDHQMRFNDADAIDFPV